MYESKPATALGHEFTSLRAFAKALGVNHRAISYRRGLGFCDDDIARHFGLMPKPGWKPPKPGEIRAES